MIQPRALLAYFKLVLTGMGYAGCFWLGSCWQEHNERDSRQALLRVVAEQREMIQEMRAAVTLVWWPEREPALRDTAVLRRDTTEVRRAAEGR